MPDAEGFYTLGALSSVPVRERPDLVAPSTRATIEALGLGDVVGVVEIDPAVSDTAATQDTYALVGENLVNCVVVTGRREGEERTAACLVNATTRADINGIVKRRLDVRKASFMAHELAVESTGMEFGGITPIGLPEAWPILVDARIPGTAVVIIGSGIRASKLLVPGAVLAQLPGAETVEELGRTVSS